MRYVRNILSVSAVAFLATLSNAFAASATKEDYIRADMPPGFQVVVTELEGPVYADAQGHTFYKWPRTALRNGDAGETEEKPACGSQPLRKNSGLMSPYPGGLELPEVATRPACTDAWPPVLATVDAKPIGKWTVVDRPDGRKQWAYDGWSLYTSMLDKKAGDTWGGSAMFNRPESGAVRHPVGPDANVPSQFIVRTTMRGRLVTLRDGWSVYSYDGEGRNKVTCTATCVDGWEPVIAAQYARTIGEWTIVERAPGIRQWAFRGAPVYRRPADLKVASLDGADIPHWHNIYTQLAPEPPKGFTMKDTMIGVVLGDSKEMTVYRYVCTDDAADQLSCDYPEAPQVYRFTVCGGGDVDRCVKTFPYIVAPAGAKSGSQAWDTMLIDPKTGKRATANQAGALNVWTFRGRPVYTFAGRKGYGDKRPTDLNGHNWGEFSGRRNGYQALVYRDLFTDLDE